MTFVCFYSVNQQQIFLCFACARGAEEKHGGGCLEPFSFYHTQYKQLTFSTGGQRKRWPGNLKQTTEHSGHHGAGPAMTSVYLQLHYDAL